MGYLICGISLMLWPLLHFPMWGSMFKGPDEGADEVGCSYRCGVLGVGCCAVCWMCAPGAGQGRMRVSAGRLHFNMWGSGSDTEVVAWTRLDQACMCFPLTSWLVLLHPTAADCCCTAACMRPTTAC